MKKKRPGRNDVPQYLIRLDSGLYIGQFRNFVHAFGHWLHLVDRENWYIVTTKKALDIIARPGSPRYFKLEEPCAWRRLWT